MLMIRVIATAIALVALAGASACSDDASTGSDEASTGDQGGNGPGPGSGGNGAGGPGGALPTEPWSQSVGGLTTDTGHSVAVDGRGNVYVTGEFLDTLDFGGAPLTNVGGGDMFLASFASDGTHRWSKRFGDAGDDANFGDAIGVSVAVDDSGNVYTTGYFAGTVDFGGGALSPGEIFVASFTSDGVHRWSKSFDSLAYGYSVAVDGSGNVYATGKFSGGIDFGGELLSAQDLHDTFLASFASDGAHRWSKRFGNDVLNSYDTDAGRSVAVDDSGNVYATGSFTDTVDFGGEALTGTSVQGNMFMASFASDGTHRWSKAFGDAVGGWLAGDGGGNLYATGNFSGTVDFGGGPFTDTGPEYGDVFAASFTSDGTHRWSKGFGGFASGRSIAVDGSSNAYARRGLPWHGDSGGACALDLGHPRWRERVAQRSRLDVGAVERGDLLVGPAHAAASLRGFHPQSSQRTRLAARGLAPAMARSSRCSSALVRS